MMLTLANLSFGTSATNAASWSDKGMGYGHRGMFMAGPDGTMFALFGIFFIVSWGLVFALLSGFIRSFLKFGAQLKSD